MLIVEGPDGAGKTTLVKRLTTTGSIHHGPLKDPFKTYLHDLALASPDTVLDRFYPSEHVYGTVLRGKNLVGPVLTRMLNRVALGRRVVLVRCLPPRELCQKNWAQRRASGGELVQDRVDYNRIYDGYASLESDLPMVTYDWTECRYGRLLEQLHELAPPANVGPGVGCFRPGNILLVGEQTAIDALYDLPFVHERGCSPWLAEQLNSIGASEQQLYWVNALDRLGRATRSDFLDQLQPQAVIALGDVAARWCAKAGVPCFEGVAHPQYWKRFKYGQPYPLLEVLREQL